jgi:pimeloyl-ACP methyl ester carboxylesterase
MSQPTAHPATTPHERRVEVAPGVSLHVEQRLGNPSAVPFVLVHGLASNVRLWDGVAERLHTLGHSVFAIDQRGHGRADAPDGGYDLETAVADLLALIGVLGLDRPVLAGQSWGGNVVLELGWRRPDTVRGIACVDGGVIELADWFPTWEDCLTAMTPPRLDHLTLAELEARMKAQLPHFSERAIGAYLHCFRTRPDGTIEPRLKRDRHLAIVRSLWENRPSVRWPTLKAPTLLLLADSGDSKRTDAKRRAETDALAKAAKVRSVWFSPGHHDLHLEFPERVADILDGAVRDGFFA